MMWTLLMGVVHADAQPHFSYPRLVSSNGHGVIVFTSDATENRGRLDVFGDHLYQQPSPAAEPTRNLLYDAYFGLRTGGGSAWLNTVPAGFGAYHPQTGIITVDRSTGDLSITEYAFAPMDLDGPGYVQLLRVENVGSQTQDGLTVFSLHNAHMGTASSDGALWVGEALSATRTGITEQGVDTGLVMHSHALSAADAVGCSGVYDAVLSGASFGASCTEEGDDVVGALQWTLPSLAPKEQAWVGVVHTFASGGDTQQAQDLATGWHAGRSAVDVLDSEIAAWGEWLSAAVIPTDLSDDELAVYLQALVMLRMGQVRESGPAHGQIVASLPASAPVGDFQHTWNITWVRDGAYAIQALSQAGFHDEARSALAFQIQDGCCGDYADYLPVDDYALSVCRYYGDGTEWSDDDGTGPNVELDNFGLFLWAVDGYVDASGDVGFVSEHAGALFDGIADVLVASIDDQYDIIIAESSIWERHWNGNQKHFTYTSAWAVRGLRDAADMADMVGDGRAEGYRQAADRIAAGMAEHLFRGDILVGNLEEKGAADLDAAAADAFNNGALSASLAMGSLQAWEEGLRVASGHGFARNDDGDLYDIQEWIMVDLRIAEVYRRVCETAKARDLETWITEQAMENNLLIPELLHPETADYAGPTPMMGFGSGLYVWSMLHRAALEADCDAPAGDTAADTGAHTGDTAPDTGPSQSNDTETGMDGGDTDAAPAAAAACGCHSAGAGGGSAVLLALVLGWCRRRRP